MTEERSAQLSSTVYDVSAGGVEALPFAIETNLVRALGIAKDQGVWTLGTSEHASESLFKIKSDRAWLVVFGNEEKGIRRLTEENCDLLCTIRCAKNSEVGSLNVSVAVASTLTHFLSGGLQ